MSADEFIVEFNILYNNIYSNQSPGLNLLQMSILMTQGKELVIKDLYSGNGGPYEANEEVTQYLQKLTKQVDYTVGNTQAGTKQYNFKLDDSCWYIVFEQADALVDGCDNTVQLFVKPVTHNEFVKAIDNPFRGPDRRTVLRLLSDDNVQLFCSSNVQLQQYTMRFLAQPSKVYLAPFNTTGAPAAPNEWTFSGDWNSYKSNVCPDLPESLHRTILIKAVQLAKAAWS